MGPVEDEREYEAHARREIEAWKSSAPSKIARANAFLTRPLDKRVGQLMNNAQIQKAMQKAMEVALDAGKWMVDEEGVTGRYREKEFSVARLEDIPRNVPLSAVDVLMRASRWRNVALGATEGAVTGFGAVTAAGAGVAGSPGTGGTSLPAGLAAALAIIATDIVAVTTLSCRAVAHHAVHYGIDLEDPAEHAHALSVLNLSLASTQEQKAQDLFAISALRNQLIRQKQPWRNLETHGVTRQIQRAAERLGKEVTQTQLRRIVSVVGVVAGAGFNASQLHEVCRASYFVFRERFLEAKYAPAERQLSRTTPRRGARVDAEGRAYRRSQLQIQIYVNRCRSELDEAILAAIPSLRGLTPRLDWVSPLERDHFREYHNSSFLKAVRLEGLEAKLLEFWPRGGPHWDALAVARSATGEDLGPVLVEAKSWPGEMYGGTAASEGSRHQIAEALANTRTWLGVSDEYGSAWLDELYQSANRLAHLYFFRECVGVPAWLVNVYFVEDPDKPTTREEWDEALAQMEAALGLTSRTVRDSGRVFLAGRGRDELAPFEQD